ncbi:MAG: hypothetical protein AAGH40_11115 [Verrucomicrobiota bacterium]
MKLNKDNIRKKRGSVLLSTLIAVIVLSVVIASLNAVLTYTRSSVERANVRVQARLLAEEGVEEAFWYVRENTIDSDPTWSSATSGSTVIYTRTDSGLNRDNRIGLIEQTVSKTTLPTGGASSYLYTIDAVAQITSLNGMEATDGLTVSTEDLSTVQELAGMRVMDNARTQWQLDQIGTYDSSIDKISGLELYSYDFNLNLDVSPTLSYPAQSLQDDPGFDLLLSYEALDLFIGSWGHAPQGSSIPYISYYSRDIADGGGTSSAINVYYARRTDVEDLQNTTLVPGDGKTFFDFITGANEAESEQAAQSSNGTTNFGKIDTDNEIIAFQDELTSNPNYAPDETQYNFYETAGTAPVKTPFDGVTYEHTPYYGGTINLNSASIDSKKADSAPANVTAASVSKYNNNKNILIQGGSVSNDQPIKFEVTNKGNIGKHLVIDSGSNVILYFNKNGSFQTDTIQVRDGGKLTIHMGPKLGSFNAQSAALALSSDPQDLIIIDEPSTSIDANGDTVYDGTDIALGDPYRQYEPYKALNLDNANHPTVATIYAPHSTVYTDHFAGVVVSEHFQSHGVIMFDRHTLENSFYISNLIDNSKPPFKTPTVRRKLYASVSGN